MGSTTAGRDPSTVVHPRREPFEHGLLPIPRLIFTGNRVDSAAVSESLQISLDHASLVLDTLASVLPSSSEASPGWDAGFFADAAWTVVEVAKATVAISAATTEQDSEAKYSFEGSEQVLYVDFVALFSISNLWFEPLLRKRDPSYHIGISSTLYDFMPTMKKNSELTCMGSVFNKLTKQVGEPVDFELPAWFTKSKPTYTSIRRNRYLFKKAKRRRSDDDGIFCSCIPSPESPSVCGIDCDCGVLLSSCSSACKCGSDCLNKPFQRRTMKRMKLVKTEKCGSGIVAAEDIKLGEFIVEYVGEVIDDKTCEERLWIMKHRGETNFYLCEISRDMVIDATYKGNKSRYINHSCCPNTEMQKWIINGETRIGIFATRDIRKGEHLTYDYQFVQFGADQECYCGAVGCRRKLGVRPSKPKISVACQVYQNGSLQVGSSCVVDQSKCFQICIGEVIRIKHLRNVRFGIIKWFNKRSRKHMIMFEDGCVEIYDMSKEEWELGRL